MKKKKKKKKEHGSVFSKMSKSFHSPNILACLLSFLPESELQQVIAENGCDTPDVTKYFAHKVLLILLFSGLLRPHRHGLRSLVSISEGIIFTFFTGVDSISRSGFSDALARIPHVVFHQMFDTVVAVATLKLPRKANRKIRLLDSTWLRLSLKRCPFAMKCRSKGQAKMCAFIEKGSWMPGGIVISTDKPDASDNRLFPKGIAWEESGWTYIHDRGSWKIKTFDRFVETNNFFISRLTSKLKPIFYKDWGLQGQIINEHCEILKDEFVWLGVNRNTSPYLYRRITFHSFHEGSVIQLLTNRFDLNPMELAELYRCRWEIESYFRWMKSHLNFAKLISLSENGFRNYLYAMLILHVLILCYRHEQNKLSRRGWTDTLRELQMTIENEAVTSLFMLGMAIGIQIGGVRIGPTPQMRITTNTKKYSYK